MQPEEEPPGASGPASIPEGVAREAQPLFAAALRREREGDYDAAFALFEEANSTVRPWKDPGAERRVHAGAMAAVRKIFTPSFFALHRPNPSPAAPIFIVGMPRSGSTLAEQILASHPRVAGLGEFSGLHEAAWRRYPYDIRAREDFEAVRRDYLAAARREGWPGWGRFTDKMLNNYYRLGLIEVLFPAAPIIHTVRDPADTCVSIFRQYFERGNDMAYDLAEIGKGYRAYREAMDHWEAMLPGRTVTLVYEDLIARPEDSVRRLLAACGLPWDNRCLRFYDNPRPVLTASADQVRRPIFTEGRGRWRLYAKHLGPLFEALGPYAPSFPAARGRMA